MIILHFMLSLILIYSPSIITSPPQAQKSSDEEQIHNLLDDYITGWREGDVERLSHVFATEQGRVMWISSQRGKEVLHSMTFDEVLQKRKPQPQYGLEWKVLSLDIVDGKLAVAKLHISRTGGSYIDFLVCHKIAGEWRIVNKTYVVR